MRPADPPRVWLLIKLGLQLKKNQRVACHETKPLAIEVKVLGQLVTSEVRSMTQKWLKCAFAAFLIVLRIHCDAFRPPINHFGDQIKKKLW